MTKNYTDLFKGTHTQCSNNTYSNAIFSESYSMNFTYIDADITIEEDLSIRMKDSNDFIKYVIDSKHDLHKDFLLSQGFTLEETQVLKLDVTDFKTSAKETAFTIEELKEEDYDAFINFSTSDYPQSMQGFVSQKIKDLKELLNLEGHRFYIAKDKETIIGSLTVHILNEDELEFDEFMVLDSYQKQGIGSKLQALAMKDAKVIYLVSDKNSPINAVYKRQGYQDVQSTNEYTKTSKHPALKIGVMGLGGIAQKAYLPIMGAMQEIDWVMHTRNQDRLDTIQRKYNFKEAYNDIEAFINSGIRAVFIHTPTHTHYSLIKKFLQAKIHVYVDKPISDNLQETQELLDYARENNLILMTGFNRRYAPFTQRLKDLDDKNMIIVTKNRENAKQDPKFALYDMMIHIVDTGLHLLDDDIVSKHISVVAKDGILERATLQVETPTTTLLAVMNMMSGGREESFQVMSKESHMRLDDLTELSSISQGIQTNERFPDWTPTLERRGFQAIISSFISHIEKNTKPDNRKTLLTHKLIEEMVHSINK